LKEFEVVRVVMVCVEADVPWFNILTDRMDDCGDGASGCGARIGVMSSGMMMGGGKLLVDVLRDSKIIE